MGVGMGSTQPILLLEISLGTNRNMSPFEMAQQNCCSLVCDQLCVSSNLCLGLRLQDSRTQGGRSIASDHLQAQKSARARGVIVLCANVVCVFRAGGAALPRRSERGCIGGGPARSLCRAAGADASAQAAPPCGLGLQPTYATTIVSHQLRQSGRHDACWCVPRMCSASRLTSISKRSAALIVCVCVCVCVSLA
jgi:hypothetical protein